MSIDRECRTDWSVLFATWLRRVALVLFVSALPPIASAADLPQGFTVQGRLLDASGTGPLEETVGLRFSVYDPTGTCLLYEEEQQGIDLDQTSGVFAVDVGSAVGAAKRTARDPGLALKAMFKNGSQLRPNHATCVGGYTPGSGDSRKLRVTILRANPTQEVVLTPDQSIQSVPQASVAETLSGRPVEDFLLKQNNVSDATLDALTAGNQDASSLHQHDSIYLRSNTNQNQNLGSGITYSVQGSIGLGTQNPDAQLGIVETSGTRPAMVIQRASSSQTAPVFQVRTEGASPTPLLTISADGNVTVHNATPSQAGHLTTKAYVDQQIATREPVLVPGLGSQYYRGDKTWAALTTAAVAEDPSNLYYRHDRARAAISAAEPLAYSVITGELTLKGLSAMGAANQMMGVKGDGTEFEYKTLKGTTNQVGVTFTSNGDIVLSAPQDLSINSTPKFSGLGLGTGSPSATLHVVGTFRLEGDPSYPAGLGKILTSDATGKARWVTPPAGNPGTVTNVTGTAPISVSNGTSTPVVSISTATSTQSGALSSTDWNTFYNKENVLTFVGPLSRVGDIVSVPQSSGASDGFLSAADFTIFASKQNAGNYVTALTGDVTSSGFSNGSVSTSLSATGVLAGTYPKVTVDSKGRVTHGDALAPSDLPSASGDVTGAYGALSVVKLRGSALGNLAPSEGQVLSWNQDAAEWRPVSIAQSQWETSGGNVYKLSGSVGLGTAVPTEQLSLTGNILLPNSTSTTGIIKQGAATLLHTYGTQNTFLGKNAGSLSTAGNGRNTGIGESALTALSAGEENTAVGASSLKATTTGSNNVAVGSRALVAANSSQNTAIGAQSMLATTGGTGNTALGYQALSLNLTGSDNVAIGRGAGSSTTSGTGNVFIGPEAGTGALATDSGKLYIANNSSSPLIFGDFSSGRVGIGTTAPSATLHLKGASPVLRIEDGTQGSNKVLLSDANGNASWGTLPNAGTVTSVSAGLPLRVVNPNSTPSLTIDMADTLTNGALSSTDWNTFNDKQDFINSASGTSTAFYYRGDKTWADFATDARKAINAEGPISYSQSTGTVGLLTVGTDKGGTGLTNIGSANQMLGVKPGGSGLEYKSLQGTANQVSVTQAAGQTTFALPQDVAITSSVQFGDVTAGTQVSAPIVNATTGFTLNNSATTGTYLRGNGSQFVESAIPIGDLPTNVLRGTGTGGYLSRYTNSNTLQSSSLYESSGNLGLGTQSPTRNFHIESNEAVAFLKSNDTASGAHSMVVLETAGTATNFPQVRLNNGGKSYAMGIDPNDAQKFKIGYNAVPSGANGSGANVDNNTRFTIDTSGRVGIGTTSPSAALHLSGSLKLDLGGAATNGQVLTYNQSTGEAKWQNLPPGNAPGIASVSVTGLPLSVTNGNSAPTLSIAQANGSTSGFLTGADWTTFNNKQAAGNYVTQITGDLTTSGFSGGPTNGSVVGTLATTGVTPGTWTKVNVDAKGRVTAGTTLTHSDIPNPLGDVIGTQGATIVSRIQGLDVSAAVPPAASVPGDFNVMGWNPTSSQWEPTMNRRAQFVPVGANPLGDLYYTGGKIGLGVNAPNEQLEIAGNFRIPATSATEGAIKQGADRVLHTYGTDNFFAGLKAGNLSTTGNRNTGIGQEALTALTTGTHNAALGGLALTANTTGSRNAALGDGSLVANTTGAKNTAVGSSVLSSNVSGSENVGVGNNSLAASTASFNTAVGASSMLNATSGASNSGFGFESLKALTAGANNVALGSGAGSGLTTGTGNVMIGYQAGAGETTGSNRLFIANSNASTPLIYGDFSTGQVGLGTNAPTARLHLVGPDKQTLRLVDGNQGAGRVLMSDGSGNAYWAAETNQGTVTGVVAAAGTPITMATSTPSAGQTVITLTMPKSDAATNGYLDETDWATFNAKQDFIEAGTTAQYWRGDKTWRDFNTDTRLALSATSPILYNNSTGVFSLDTVPVAKGGTNLTSTGTANQLMGVSNAAGTLEYKTLNGTSNQLTVTHAPNAITLALPQDIATSSNPTFNILNATTGIKINNAATTATYLRGNGTNYVPSTIQQSDLPSTSVYGNGTAGRIVKYSGASTLADSQLFETATGIGIGTVTPSTSLNVEQSKTDAAQASGAIFGRATTTTATSGAHDTRGMIGESAVSVAASQTNSGDASGVLGRSNRNGGSDSGTLTSQAAFTGEYGQAAAGAGNTTHSYGLHLTHSRLGGTVTNHYGIRLDTTGGGATVTNNFGLYQTDATAKNYFAGRVGIGATSPGSLLEVNSSTVNEGIYLKNGATTNASLSNVGASTGQLELLDGGASKIKLNAASGASTLSYINNGGKFGIGTAAPTSTLHVAGATRLVDGTEGNYKILTSDANGNASWKFLNAIDATTNNATSTNTGLLTSTDWVTFNDKQTSNLADGKMWLGNGSGKAAPVTLSGEATISNTGVLTLSNTTVVAGQYTKVTVDAKGRVTAGTTLAPGDIDAVDVPNAAGDVTGPYTGLTVVKLQGRNLASTAPAANQILVWNSGASQWEPQNNTSSQWSNTGADIYFNTGKVGIGVTNPSSRLYVANGEAMFDYSATPPSSGAAVRISSSATDSTLSSNNYDATGIKYARTGGASSVVMDTSTTATAGDIAFNTAASGTAGNAVTLSERLRIKQGGNVGIGTGSPSAKVEVRSTTEALRLSYDVGNYFTMTPTSGGALQLQSSGSGAFSVGGTGATNRTSIASTGALSVDSTANSSFTGTGNVGIGTLSPGTTKLVVSGAVAGENARVESSQTSNYLTVKNSAGKETRLGQDGDGFLSVYDGTTAVRSVTLQQGGNVGVGVSSPGAKLDVGGDIRLSGGTQLLREVDTSTLSLMSATGVSKGSYLKLWSDGAGSPGQVNLTSKGTGAMIFSNAPLASSVETELMRLTSTGGLGIGTNAPSEKLEVAGNIKASGTVTASDFILSGGGSLVGSFVQKAGDTMTGTLSVPSNGLVVGTNQLIATGGNIGVGVSSPAAKTEVRSTTEALRLSYDASNFTSFTAKSAGDLHVDTSGTGAVVIGSYGATSRTSISSDGALSVNSSTNSSFTGTGNLGIGNSSPSEKLEVTGNIKNSGNLLPAGNIGVGVASPTARLHLPASTTQPSSAPLKFASGTLMTTPEAGAMEYDGNNLYYTESAGTRRTLSYLSKADTDYVNVTGDTMSGTLNLPSNGLVVGTTQLVASGGKVGIGTASPTAGATLDVLSSNNSNRWRFFDGASNATPYIAMSGTGVKSMALMSGLSGNVFTFDDTGFFGIFKDTKTNIDGGTSMGGTALMKVMPTGYVGINTASPGANLEVTGSLKLNLTGAAAGKILTSDASGNATWVSPANSGTVTSVTANAPLTVANGTTTPTISIPVSNGTTDGYLSSANWTTFNNKEPPITAGTASQYWKGDKTWGSFNADARAALSFTPPIDYNFLTGNISLATVTVAKGGTNLTSLGTANQMLGVNAGATALEYKSFNGTSNQVNITNAAGSMTFSLPQSIATSSAVQFDTVNATTGFKVGGAAASGTYLRGDGSKYASSTILLADLPATVVRTAATGVLNYLPKYTAAATQTNSQILDNGTSVGINTASPSATFDVVRDSGAAASNPVIRAANSAAFNDTSAINTSWIPSNSSGSTTATGRGVYVQMNRSSPGDNATVAAIAGVDVAIGHKGGVSTTSDVYGMRVQMNHQNGSISNSYGLYIQQGATGGTVTNNYGIFQSGATMANILNGKLTVGALDAGSYTFEVAGTSALRGNTLVDGNVTPHQDAIFNVGSAARRWNTIFASNGTINTSDGRLKTDIRDSDLGLDFVLGVRPVSYQWKDPAQGTKTHYGVIAQELEKNLKGRSFAGLDYDEKADRYGVAYTEFVAPLIKAVQELYGKLTGHDRQIAALKAENDKLKAKAEAQDKLLQDLASRVQKLEGLPASSSRKPASR